MLNEEPKALSLAFLLDTHFQQIANENEILGLLEIRSNYIMILGAFYFNNTQDLNASLQLGHSSINFRIFSFRNRYIKLNEEKTVIIPYACNP